MLVPKLNIVLSVTDDISSILSFSNLEKYCFNRASVVVDDRLFVIGGQEGDFMAKPGSPIFKCSRRHEVHDFEIYDNLHDMFGTHD